MKNVRKKVYVAMSGGVDSSVAALLLKQKGYDVTGVFMKYWMDKDDISGGKENKCCSLDARRDAMRVCAHLGIPFLTWDFQKEFKKAVVDDFVRQYKNGLTPNPCVICNKEIKLGIFLKRAIKEGADFVATGHYAKNQESRIKNQGKSGIIYKLCQAKDKHKDQSYFLYNLRQDQLAHILFPLQNLIKDEVRKIAVKDGLPVAGKQDSQEVCFVNKGELKEFLSRKMKLKEGDIVLSGGESIGRHQGVQFYTIGQRAPVGGVGPYYVIGKSIKKNKLIVAKNGDNDLFLKYMTVQDMNWIAGKAPSFPLKVKIKTRYQSSCEGAILQKGESAGSVSVKFMKPQRAITPGQSAVFYNGKEIIGGGVIA